MRVNSEIPACSVETGKIKFALFTGVTIFCLAVTGSLPVKPARMTQMSTWKMGTNIQICEEGALS